MILNVQALVTSIRGHDPEGVTQSVLRDVTPAVSAQAGRGAFKELTGFSGAVMIWRAICLGYQSGAVEAIVEPFTAPPDSRVGLRLEIDAKVPDGALALQGADVDREHQRLGFYRQAGRVVIDWIRGRAGTFLQEAAQRLKQLKGVFSDDFQVKYELSTSALFRCGFRAWKLSKGGRRAGRPGVHDQSPDSRHGRRARFGVVPSP